MQPLCQRVAWRSIYMVLDTTGWQCLTNQGSILYVQKLYQAVLYHVYASLPRYIYQLPKNCLLCLPACPATRSLSRWGHSHHCHHQTRSQIHCMQFAMKPPVSRAAEALC